MHKVYIGDHLFSSVFGLFSPRLLFVVGRVVYGILAYGYSLAKEYLNMKLIGEQQVGRRYICVCLRRLMSIFLTIG